MDSIKAQKFHAMRSYKKSQFLYNLILYSLTIFLSSLLYLYLFWFPSMNHFLFVYLLNIYSFFSSPKFLFILGNAIVIILVGESKLTGSHSSPATEIYDEYIERSRSLRERSIPENKKKNDKVEVHMKKEKSITKRVDKNILSLKEKEKEMAQESDHKCNQAVDHKLDGMEEGREEEEKLGHLHRDELNRRVEEFIARVNRRRMLEARQLVCSGD